MADVRRTLTPELSVGADTRLVLIDLGRGRDRLGGSCLAQVHGRIGREPPDCDDPGLLRRFFAAIVELRADGLLLAYHDRSDGGLFVTLCEMAFAGRCGLEIESLGPGPGTDAAALFSEELGAVVQCAADSLGRVLGRLGELGLGECSRAIGRVDDADRIRIARGGRVLVDATRSELRAAWSETTWRMQSLRDNPDCARQEYDRLLDAADPGLHASLTFDPAENIAAPFLARGARPRIAILREQGVNGQIEMAAALTAPGSRRQTCT